jgi:hypothetical protein
MDTSVPAFALAPRGAAITEAARPQILNPMTTEAGRRNGDFEIRGVRPGLYDLFPVVPALLNGLQAQAVRAPGCNLAISQLFLTNRHVLVLQPQSE